MSHIKRSLPLLLSRLLIGGIFITTGWMKVSDMATTIGYFNTMHIPAFLAYVVGYSELIGGVLIVLGAFTCIATALLAVIMLFAIYFSYPLGMQFYMTPVAMLGGLLALHGAGAGKFALGCKCKICADKE